MNFVATSIAASMVNANEHTALAVAISYLFASSACTAFQAIMIAMTEARTAMIPKSIIILLAVVMEKG